MNETPHSVLHFWFQETPPELRFSKNESFDRKIRDRFLSTYEQIREGAFEDWKDSAEGTLALIIILDQFSRNMFRDTARMFESDEQALAIALEGIQMGRDKEIPIEQRAFFYMPLMHSEDIKVHDQALQLFSAPGLENNLKFEFLHRNILDKFGRYPHRNKILGRTSTEQEIEFLKTPGSSF